MISNILLFDIDDTIAERNNPIPRDLIEVLQRISINNQIVLVSGKPSCYIYGMLRQIGTINNIAVIGENGATVSIGTHFPPKNFYSFQLTTDLKNLFSKIKYKCQELYGNQIWFQPNEINLTIFPKKKSLLCDLHSTLASFSNDYCLIYKHSDSIEILPKYINKEIAVKKFLEISTFNKNNYKIYAFGDSDNDLPMLNMADFVYIVGNKLEYNKKHTKLKNIKELTILLNKTF